MNAEESGADTSANLGITLERLDGVASITIDRQGALNALNIAVVEEMNRALDAVEGDQDVRAVLFTGAGEKAFVAGADIAELQSMTPSVARRLIGAGHRLLARLEALPLPVVAAVNGYALGGGLELALACDIRICSSNARFGLPEAKIGVIPGWGGTVRLARVVGEGRAKEMIYTGRVIDASEAERIGLVTEVLPSVDELRRYAREFVQELAKSATISLGLEKWMIHRSRGFDTEIIRGGDELALAYCFTTEDTQEGIRAFLEKKKAMFMGR